MDHIRIIIIKKLENMKLNMMNQFMKSEPKYETEESAFYPKNDYLIKTEEIIEPVYGKTIVNNYEKSYPIREKIIKKRKNR